MNGILKNKLTACVFILTVITAGLVLSDDVTVQEGSMYIDRGLKVGNNKLYVPSGYGSVIVSNSALIGSNLDVYGDIDVDDDLDVNEELEVGDIDCSSGDLYADSVYAYASMIAIGYIICAGELEVWDKIDSWGGYDPPYVLYDRQSREEVIERIKNEVSPEKQGGAALFFNKQTKRLETYVASEGKFYDLQGNMIYQLSSAVVPEGEYESHFGFISSTGQVVEKKKRVKDKYRIKIGYLFDNKTGNFINRETRVVVPREEALEIYSASEGKFYDLERNFLRDEKKEEPVKYVREVYDFDSKTGEVTMKLKAVKEKYRIKEGYMFNKQTGEFVNISTREVAPKEEAVEFVSYKMIADKMAAVKTADN